MNKPALIEHNYVAHEREGWSVCSRCGMVRNYDRPIAGCRGTAPLAVDSSHNDEDHKHDDERGRVLAAVADALDDALSSSDLGEPTERPAVMITAGAHDALWELIRMMREGRMP